MTLAINSLLAPLFAGVFRAARVPRPSTQPRLVPAVHGPMSIDKGATLVVERAVGKGVCCVTGSLWITLDGDPKDVVIEAGDTYVGERPGRMLVYGLAASTALLV